MTHRTLARIWFCITFMFLGLAGLHIYLSTQSGLSPDVPAMRQNANWMQLPSGQQPQLRVNTDAPPQSSQLVNIAATIGYLMAAGTAFISFIIERSEARKAGSSEPVSFAKFTRYWPTRLR
jgi:hypothetical protein